MSSRPFRDPDGALERAALLERENAELLEQIEQLRSAVAEAHDARSKDEVVQRLTKARDQLAGELDKLRHSAPAALDRATSELKEQRDELAKEVLTLRDDLRAIEDQLRRRGGDPETARELARQTRRATDLERRRDELRTEIDALRVEVVGLRNLRQPSSANDHAVLRRAMEERDELLREIRELNEAAAETARQKSAGGRSLLSRIFGRR